MDEEQDFKERAGAVLITMVQIKTFMLREGQIEHQTECPRCGEILRARLIPPKNHIRMACDGDCGMSCLE